MRINPGRYDAEMDESPKRSRFRSAVSITLTLVVCHSLILGLGATGCASANVDHANLQSTGRASGTPLFSFDRALVVLYLGSLGPACWIELRRGFADTPVFNAIYFPVMWGWEHAPHPFYNWIKLYANGGGLGRYVVVPSHGPLA